MHPLAGRKQTPEHIAKRMAAWHLSPAREKARGRFLALNKARIGQPLSESHRAKQSEMMKGRSSEWLRGRVLPESHRRKIAETFRRDITKHPRYIDGRSFGVQAARRSMEYREWRDTVFARDDWTCVLCGVRGGRLEADHLKSFADFPDLRFDVSNGRTLCRPCHCKTDNYGFRGRRRP